MLKNLLLVLSIIITTISQAQKQEFSSKIESAIVFRSGAQITRSINTKLNSGLNEIMLKDIPLGIDESSVQISINQNASIFSYSFNKIYSFTHEKSPLELELQKLQINKENENIIYDSFDEEVKLILNNQKVSGEQSGLTGAQLLSVADVYRSRLIDAKQKKLESHRRLIKIDEEIMAIKSKISEFYNKNNKEINQMKISIDAPINTVYSISLTYIDPRASWTNSYDLRLKNLQSDLQLVNKAKIKQSTGEKWENIKLSLSTGNPNLNTTAPEINPWFLNFYQRYFNDATKSKTNEIASVRGSRTEATVYYLDGIQYNGRNIESSENITIMEHKVDGFITIESNNQDHELVINDNNIKAIYNYIAIPSKDTRTYLIAKIPDWSQYSFSTGEIKLFFEGTFVGTSFLNANQASDTLALSLGPDIAIATKRELLKEFKSTKFFSTKKEIQIGYEISLKNNKSVAIELELKDQIPISSNSELEVNSIEISGGKLEAETGIITWKLTLKPGEQIKKRLIYKVKLPKDKNIQL